jgi:hypothetical protein
MGAKYGGNGETDAQKRAEKSNKEQFAWQQKTYEDDIARQLNEAAIARAQEEERQTRINTGLAKVDKIFDPYEGKSGKKYYRGLTRQYTGAYMPEVRRQYGQAKQENLFSLARNGNVDSSAAATASADLASQKGQQELAIRQRGTGYANQARQSIEGRRQTLINQVYSTADPTTVSAQGVTTGEKAVNFNADPATFSLPGMDYSPLGSLFTTAATGVNAYQNASTYGGGTSQPGAFLNRKTNEGKVVS